MISLVPHSEHADFKGASLEARSIAVGSGHTVKVERSSGGWIVLVPPSVHEEILECVDEREDDTAEDATDDFFADQVEANSRTKEDDDLQSEIQDDQDSYARSDDGGWFYED